MNIPTFPMLSAFLTWLGSNTLGLSSGSIGLIAAPFSGSQSTTLASLTEANYGGYARQALAGPSAVFNGSDGKVYTEFNTLEFAPTGSTSPNTIYGLFYLGGGSSTVPFQTDALAAPFYMGGATNRLTIIPRCGLDPAGNYGLNVISS